jgi:hypothetical protein
LGCLENTRKDIIEDMLAWAAKPDAKMSIFWLAGLAGTGKSTLAKTFCERVPSEDRLVATFFASRGSAERRDPLNIIHTFAYELAVANDHIRPHVLSAISSPPDIMQRSMKEQVERLILEPLTRAQLSKYTIILVIDALDECFKIDGHVEGGPLVSLLANALHDRPVKLLIASRQEHSLERLFQSLSHIPLRLQEVASADVEMDVRQIFDKGFADIRRHHSQGLGTKPWPSHPDLDTLVRLTGHFLIFATTALNYVGEERFSPEVRLGEVLARSTTLEGDSPYVQIDTLYADILQAATQDKQGRISLALCRRVGDLLRTVILLEEPLPVSALAGLMRAPEAQISSDVKSLAAVLVVSTDTADSSIAPVRVFHSSFRDFLLDPQRCRETNFVVRHKEHQEQLLSRCLDILNENLRRDICDIENPSLANSEILDLAIRLQTSVSGALRYASVFWLVHLPACGWLSEVLCETLLKFCQRHLLHWVELLSLLDRTSFALKHLPSAVAWCQVRNHCQLFLSGG